MIAGVRSIAERLRRQLANVASILGLLPLYLLFMPDGYQYLVPVILWNNFMDDLDGVLAAKLGIRSQFGADLDNVCDAIAHTVFVMVVGMHYGGICAAVSLLATTAIVIRVVSRIGPAATAGVGSPTNELIRHMLFVLLLAEVFGFGAAPFLIATFATHTVSMLLPHKLPYLLRNLTKSVTAVALLNVALVLISQSRLCVARRTSLFNS